MTKTKIKRITGIDEQIRQLEEQRKQLIQKQKQEERNARTKRLIERGAILERLIMGADTLSNEQIKTLLEKTVETLFADKILAGLRPQEKAIVTAKPVNAGHPGQAPAHEQQEQTALPGA